MFSSDSSRGSAATSTTGETAKRVLSSFLETSGLVCGSLKDTVEDKLADKDMDMKWVKHELHNINTKLEKPREQILNMTEKACAMGGNKKGRGGTSNNDDYGLVGSPPVVLQHSSMGLGATNSSFLDETIDNDDTHTFTTVDGGRTLSVNTTLDNNHTLDNNDDEETMASTLMTAETPPKHKSRFAAVLNEQKQYETDVAEAAAAQRAAGGSNVVIGLCLSRNNSTLGHPDTVTRQTAFDFNELQDRDYKYVSSTDDSGWMAGGGERGDPYLSGVPREFDPNHSTTSGSGGAGVVVGSGSEDNGIKVKSFGAGHKIAAPDRVHIPIIQINAASSAVIDEIVSALARGEIFIPQVSILPETLSVNQTSPPDLQVHFGCDKNDDTNPEDWTNWCLEFLHNQLYEYFAPMGAQWSKRPFQITLARKVRWATVKHMNKYFARSEQVINSWREKGPQYLQPPYSDDSSRGVILEEITRPHGIYLIQNGKPTNYFAPNFQPPYTTKMRRSLIRNVINKSWDAKHRDWLSQPLPRMRGPVQLISSVMGCANPGHLSPVEERAVSSNVGAFHMRTDFDMVHDSRDMNVRPETPPEQQHHEEVRSSRNKDRRKEDSHHHHHSDKQHMHDSPRREINSRPTPSIPSDESYGTSTRPSGTMSLSLEESMTDPTTDDPITASRTQSTSESPERNKQWSGDMLSSPGKDPQDKHFFNGSGNGGTSSFGSTSKVSFSDSSLAESERERERKSDSEQQPRQNRSSENQPPVHSPMRKVDDRRGDKFAKTKSKRREMRDQRRQDENVERIAPSSKNSDIPRRGMNDSDGISSPSADSMAYSLDSRSQFGFPVAPANDAGSVMTMGTDNQSLLSYVTRSTMVHSRFQEDENQPKDPEPSEPEGDDISLSLLESKSTIVPGDEELNAVGWAKALDPNSGSYYYFTLDRQKTVWENPLGTSP